MTPTLYQQLQGLYVAGDVLCAVDVVRALPDYRHVLFVNHDEGWDPSVEAMLYALDAEVRRAALLGEEDLDESVSAVLYHCVGYDDDRHGSYVRFQEEPPRVLLAAWLHTPGCADRRPGATTTWASLAVRGCSSAAPSTCTTRRCPTSARMSRGGSRILWRSTDTLG